VDVPPYNKCYTRLYREIGRRRKMSKSLRLMYVTAKSEDYFGADIIDCGVAGYDYTEQK